MRAGIWDGKRCSCGSKTGAVYISRVTIFERIAFWMGWWKSPDLSKLLYTPQELAGELSLFRNQWNAAPAAQE